MKRTAPIALYYGKTQRSDADEIFPNLEVVDGRQKEDP